MSRKKRKAKINPVFSNDILKDHFSMMYVSQLRSKAYIELSLPAKLLYCTLRVHSNSPEERECLSMHGKETGIEYDPDIFFVFPASHQRLYGYKDRRNVEKYMRELNAAGFIKKVESNWNLRQVTVYQFVSDWKT